LIDPIPLILIVGLDPGIPPDEIIWTPGTEPWIAWVTEVAFEDSIISVPIWVTEPTIDCFVWVPYAVTITSSRALSDDNVTLIVNEEPTVISTVW
jgi:hypothetical protein